MDKAGKKTIKRIKKYLKREVEDLNTEVVSYEITYLNKANGIIDLLINVKYKDVIYRIKDGTKIYIGKTKRLKERMQDHRKRFSKSMEYKIICKNPNENRNENYFINRYKNALKNSQYEVVNIQDGEFKHEVNNSTLYRTIRYKILELTPTQKAIIAYERFVVQEKYSLSKTAKEAKIRRANLINCKYIARNNYAIEHDYIKTLKSGSAVKLPNGKYSSSLQTIKNALMAYEEELSNRTNNNNDKEEPTKTIDYERIFSEYDIEDKISEPFWDMKSNFNIISLDGSIYLIWCLLRATYGDKYDFDNDLTIEKLTKLATL